MGKEEPIEISLPEGISREDIERVFLSYTERRRGRIGYKVLVREPGENLGHTIERVKHIQEGRDLIKDMASTYPEDTLLYIQSASGQGGLKETYLVNEWGEAVRRFGRGWIPHGGIPIERVDVSRFKTLPQALDSIRRGYAHKSYLEDEPEEEV